MAFCFCLKQSQWHPETTQSAELLKKTGDALMQIERICHYLKIIVVVELLTTLMAGRFITNLHPYWMQLLVFPYLSILDLITIVLWLVCRTVRARSVQDSI
jgi:hypothetical protein